MKYQHLWTGLMAIAVAAQMASCAPIVDARGHTTDVEDFKQIIPNQSTEADVRALLGSPSATSNFGPLTWYYITEHKETVGMLAPEVTEQHVYAIHFNPSHVVIDIAEYKKDDAEPVQIVQKSTPTEGNEITFIQQLFGNFGRFGTPGRTIDPLNGR